MAQINFADRTLNSKIVYCGPGLSGKTSNLEFIYERIPPAQRGELTSISTYGDRTIFYDYLPIDLGSILGLTTRIQLYTVPGQPYYASTRKLVLVGVDGVMFVADSQPGQMQENLSALKEIEDELREHGKSLDDLPLVFQWNKRDLPGVLEPIELERQLNRFAAPSYETVATRGEGVMTSLKALAGRVLERCKEEYGGTGKPVRPKSSQGRASAPPARPRKVDPPSGLDSEAAIMTQDFAGSETTSAIHDADLEPEGKAPLSIPLESADDVGEAEGVDPAIGQTVGGCVILAKLGEGGMGTAYLARHTTLNKDFVVKTLKQTQAKSPNSVKRFFQEARSTARLDHENVVRVQDVGTSDRGMHYMVMQYFDGENLEDLVRDRGPFPPKKALKVVLQIARALSAVHAAGVIHRDIKPQNVILTKKGQIKLIDFGLARDLGDEVKLTRTGALVGTPAYMAPEMVRTREFDGRVDLFALGLTFYFLLTGRIPFLGSDVQDLFLNKARLEPPESFVPELEVGYRHMLEKLLAKDPTLRYADAAALIHDLSLMRKGAAVPAPQVEGNFWLWEEKLRSSDEDTKILSADAAAELVKVAIEGGGPHVPPGLADEIQQAAGDPKNHIADTILLSRIDEGPLGELWRAWQPLKGRLVLLRRLRGFDELDVKSRRELDAITRLRHDHIAPLLDHECEDGELLLLHRPVPGQSLSSTRHKAKRVVRGVRDAARALEFAITRDTPHLGLTPESLLIDEFGRGQLLDFGVWNAVRRAARRGATELPKISTRFHAPERLRGKGDARSEVYALGALFYFGLTRQPPGTGTIVPPRQLARGIPKPLEAICLKCLAQAPEDRYQTPGDLAKELHSFLKAGRTGAPRDPGKP